MSTDALKVASPEDFCCYSQNGFTILSVEVNLTTAIDSLLESQSFLYAQNRSQKEVTTIGTRKPDKISQFCFEKGI